MPTKSTARLTALETQRRVAALSASADAADADARDRAAGTASSAAHETHDLDGYNLPFTD